MRSISHQMLRASPAFEDEQESLKLQCPFDQLTVEVWLVHQPFERTLVSYHFERCVFYVRFQFALELARETQENGCNLRSRTREFQVRDIMYKRLFNLSNAANRYNTKLDQQFMKAKVIGRVGTVQYELKDMDGHDLGVDHAKDLKV